MASEAHKHLLLKGTTALTTGASRGIGASIAYELACRGADVALIYGSPGSDSLIRDLERRITSLPHKPKAFSICEDLRRIEAASGIVEYLTCWRGGKASTRVDILVNNAGMELVKKLEDITPEDFEAVYNLNIRAPLLLTKALLPYMPSSSRIINIGSVGARAGFPNLSLYCSSKAALEA